MTAQDARTGRGGRALTSAALGAWLREQRRARGWDVPEMARRLITAAGDMRRSLPSRECLLIYIRRWERGEVGVSERYTFLYCKAFAIDLEQFGPAVYGPAPEADPGAGPDEGPPPEAGPPGNVLITIHVEISADRAG